MDSLARSAAVLALGNLATRILGLAYRVLLVRWLGGEGLGLFQMALSLYFSLVQPLASSLPAALSQVLAQAKDRGGPGPPERRLVAQAGGLSMALALASALAVGRLPPDLLGGAWQAVRQVMWLPLLHATLVCAVSAAALRGLLLAYGRASALAWGLVAEQAVRLAFLSALLAAVAPEAWDLARRVRAVLWNLLLGELADALVLAAAAARLWLQPWPVRRREEAVRLGAVLRLALPMAGQRAFYALEHLAEATLIPVLLQRSGFSPADALAAYGALTGVAAPLLQLPMVAVGALAQALVPGVAELARQPAARAHRIRRALRWAAEAGGAAGLALALAGPQLARWLYAADASSPVAVAAVAYLAPAAFFLYLDATAAAVLRGLGRAHEPFWVDMAAALTRFGLMAWWCGAWGLGLAGVAAAAVVAVALACLGDVALVARRAGLSSRFLLELAHPMTAALAAQAVALAFPLPLSLGVGAAAYGLMRAVLRFIPLAGAARS